MESQRNISEFILTGLSYDHHVQFFCFGLLLLCYVVLLMGNLLVLVSIQCSFLIHQPMYYFLSHLSTVDICYTSCVTPKLIGDLLVTTKTISYDSCMLQVFSMHFFGMIEVFILTVMAFDRCVAICKPLHYMAIMNRTRCNLLVLAAWTGGAVHSFSQISMIIWLPFCGPNEIDHYYCAIFPLLKVACTDTYIIGFLIVANSGMVALVTFVLLFGSYVIILFTLRNHSAEGRLKALSTCGSHITVVVLFFGPSIFAYLRPPTTYPEDKIFSLFYTIFAPMLNPLIYTLRNTEMKKAMTIVWCQKVFFKRKT
ncbi:olfactory receptor 4P4-like [Tenrec ecaudatus]|uniref:olfactory receptor 4P4-like n=1 Tax=Tenrec ecaudatus TaxID=94439 RepID=UPI003F5A9BDC